MHSPFESILVSGSVCVISKRIVLPVQRLALNIAKGSSKGCKSLVSGLRTTARSRYRQPHGLSVALLALSAMWLTACAPGVVHTGSAPSHAASSRAPGSRAPGSSALVPNPQPVVQLNGLDTGLIMRWFEEARLIVARDQGVDLGNLTAVIANDQQIATHARASLLGALSHDLTNTDFAESLVDNILNVQTASVLAIYSPEQRKILMHKDNLADYVRATRTTSSSNANNGRADIANDKAAVQALLIHELIHASDHIRFDAFSSKKASYQEVFAKSTIIEGHAQWHTRRLCKSAGCSGAFDTLNQYMFEIDEPGDPALEYVQSRNFKSLEFVYKEGERFIDALMHRPNGSALVQTAFTSPPRDSIQIIDPASFPNRAREVRNLMLSTVIESSEKPWSEHRKGTLKRNVLAAAAFSVNPEARRPIVDFYTTKILATAKHEYYDRESDAPIPIAIIALQTDTINTAANTAELIFDSTARTYNELNGTLVELNNWNTRRHTANVDRKDKPPLRIDMYTASGRMKNGMINAEYPIEVVTATAGNYIVHIDGRYARGRDDLMQLAGQLLTKLTPD